MSPERLKQHISHQFNQELEEIRASVLDMGRLVTQQIRDAVTALIEQDLPLAQKVRSNERTINSMELDIDAKCALIIARRQPAASDLRLLLGSIKSITDIERMGDEAKHIAKCARKLEEGESDEHFGLTDARKIGEKLCVMTEATFAAYASADAEQARALMARDREIDSAHQSAIAKQLEHISNDPNRIYTEVNVIWALRAMERIGDHCMNICENVVYMVEGEDIRYPGQSQPEAK